jgi:hypothetical protein
MALLQTTWRADPNTALYVACFATAAGPVPRGWIEAITRVQDVGVVQGMRSDDIKEADFDARWIASVKQIANWHAGAMYFDLRLLCATGGPADVKLSVIQNDKIIAAYDPSDILSPINKRGRGFEPVTLGQISAPEGKATVFSIVFF